MPEWGYWRWIGGAYALYSLWAWPEALMLGSLAVFGMASGGTLMLRVMRRLTPRLVEAAGQWLVSYRRVFARCLVVTVVALGLLLAASLCAYHLVAELSFLRSVATAPHGNSGAGASDSLYAAVLAVRQPPRSLFYCHLLV